MTKRAASETWRLAQDVTGDWQQAAQFGTQLVFAPGKNVYLQGGVSSYFFVILSGKIEVSMLREDGTSFMVEVMGPGAVCREAAAFDGLPSFSAAHAVEKTTVLRFDAAMLKEVFATDPGLAVSLIRVFAIKQRIMSRRAQHLSAASPDVRITELLQRLANNYGVAEARGTLIPFLVTHEQIASMAGISRVTVTRTLTRMRKVGEIVMSGGRILMVGFFG